MIQAHKLDSLYTDGAVIEKPATVGYEPGFLDYVICTGSEVYFNECIHDTPPIGGCSREAISWLKTTSECAYTLHKTIIFFAAESSFFENFLMLVYIIIITSIGMVY